MTDSILKSIRKVVGVGPEDDSFDIDLIMHINSVLSILHQLGIGPDEGFMIENEVPTWAQFIGDEKTLNPVKSYVYLRVRLLFDPPQNSFLVTSMENQVKEMEWRLNVRREEVKYPWQDPSTMTSLTTE